jgi:hypothetical protein
MQSIRNYQIFLEQAASAAVLTLGLGNEYFCRPQPLKEAKTTSKELIPSAFGETRIIAAVTPYEVNMLS